MNLWKEYRQPTSISEAIEDLQNAPGPVFPIAGGTDLLLDIKQGRHHPANTLVDLMNVAEMNVIEVRGDKIFIGASVPVNRIISNPLTNEHAQALVEACDLIAGPQVRNTATLGGNAAHALPAADGTIALVALNAEVEIASPEGINRKPFVDLFVGPGKSSLNKQSEIISGFYSPLMEQNQASCFKRIMRPQGTALPILNCAVWVSREGNVIEDIRIAVGPGGPTPFRATDAESSLRGEQFTDQAMSNAMALLVEQAKFRDSPRRASANYRKHIASSLFLDTFKQAWRRAES